MTKKNLIILGLVIIVVITVIIALWPKKTETKIIKEEKIIIPTREILKTESETGAMDISMSEDQYSAVYLIKNLRNNCPIDRNNFSVDFDYNVNKFLVTYKNDSGGSDFQKWLNETGYNIISESYFQIK